jgi:GNAT superfamily N-acetyltransferase
MELVFKKHQENPQWFFQLLPKSWQKGIVPYWYTYSGKAEIYTIEEDGTIVAGGVVFKDFSEDLKYFKEEAKYWLGLGYYYLGYIWVVKSKRGQNLGSKWLVELLKQHPNTNFWLTIEEEKLKSFYLKNGFRLIKKLQKGKTTEWLLVYEK